MNCTQAQVLLATYREIKNNEVDTTELDMHLEQCPSCRQVLAGYSFIGEQVRSLPSLEPSADMHSKLMRALAVEHMQFIQKSVAASPPPEFLKPYLREHALFTGESVTSEANWRQHSSKTNSLAAFSRADTGPLPVLHQASISPLAAPDPQRRWREGWASRTDKKQRRSHIGQFAVIGMVAVFFIALMMGGLTTLLFLAHDNLPGRTGAIIINPPIDVTSAKYTTSTEYQHVVSAVADHTFIYYSAYRDDNSWMLEQLDRTTKVSIPLLTTPATSPLIVLGSENGWLVWLQLDAPKLTTRTILHQEVHSLSKTWSLHALSLVTQQQNGIIMPNKPTTLASGTFNQQTAPGWVHTPVQGVWFVQNSLLVAMIDGNGISHLMSYPLDPKSIFSALEIAKAAPGHILTSPTANSDGSKIYWADEWRTADDSLHSSIWTQQVFDTPNPTIGHLAQQTLTEKQQVLQDGTSFRPLVVDDTLFFLSTANGIDALQTTVGTTATATPSSTPVPAATSATTTPTVSWADTSVYSAAADNDVRGALLMLPLGDSPGASPTIMNTTGPASLLQAGRDFVLWQNDDGSYGMFDAAAKTDVTVGDILTGAHFLAVNGDTAVWTVDNTANPASNSTSPLATLMAFNWPRK